MKKILVALAALLLLTGCAAKVDLMSHASPETSALSLYVYDGETVQGGYLFDESRAKVIREFREAKAKPAEVDVTTLQPPYYGLEMGTGGETVGSVHGLWADGYFITDSGEAYRLEYDFEKLLKKENWENWRNFSDLTVMPCASHMAKTEAGWNRRFLSEAESLEAPEGITMELLSYSPDAVVAQFTNHSGREWVYGLSYRVQVQLEGQWYHVPSEQEYAIIDIAMVLPNGESCKESYNLKFYGDLPAGNYRLAAEGLAAEFTVE